MKNLSRNIVLLTTALFLLLTAGCATQLAPQYDQAISDGLASANKDVQTLFASLDNGVSKETYSTRVDSYNHIIGNLNALEIQAKSRPIPVSNSLVDVNKILGANGLGGLSQDPQFTNFPSARAIHDASKTIQKMRAVDEKAGLHGAEIDAFKNQASTFLSQAITYETFLKR